MTVNAIKTIMVSREDLYEQVWKMPMRKLASRYGLSDVGLAKVCKSHDIPKPPVGYWAKKDVGKAPPQTPLPRNDDPKIQHVKLWDGPRTDPVPEPPRDYDKDILEMLGRAMSLPPVSIAATLHNLHPLIRKTRDAIEHQTYEKHGLVSPSGMRTDPVVEVSVAKTNIRRALLFMDALFKAIETVGGTIAIEKPHHWQPAAAVVRFGNVEIGGIRIRERYKQVKRPDNDKSRWMYPSHDYHPTGRLVLDHAPPSYDQPYAEDGDKPGRRIEERINKIIIKWINQAGQTRIKQHREEEDRRARAEQERIRREKEAELKRRRDELLRQQRAEQEKVDRLLYEAECWQKSQQIRAYLAAIERSLRDLSQPPAADSDLTVWLRWASQQADRLDPLTPSPPSILNQRLDPD
jgi:hypothetical protein